MALSLQVSVAHLIMIMMIIMALSDMEVIHPHFHLLPLLEHVSHYKYVESQSYLMTKYDFCWINFGNVMQLFNPLIEIYGCYGD